MPATQQLSATSRRRPSAIERRQFLRGALVLASAAPLGLGFASGGGGRRAEAAEHSQAKAACLAPAQSRQNPADPAKPWPEAMPATEMAAGETRQIADINPSVYYYSSLIQLTPGAVYRFSAEGCWADDKIPAGPDGWLAFLLEVGARLPFRRLFLLCGSIGRSDDRIFAIGKGRTWRAPAAQEMGGNRQLYLFPNDWKLKGVYRNNQRISSQPMQLTVQRLS